MTPSQGLYRSEFEHDACGVGLIADTKGRPSHHIVDSCLTMLERMDHRGACGCDPSTGDGSGIMTSLPVDFYNSLLEDQGVELSDGNELAVGMLFLPKDTLLRQHTMSMIDENIESSNLKLLAWRQVPRNSDFMGSLAEKSVPSIWQVFVEGDKGLEIRALLYALRRQIEMEFENDERFNKDRPYFCSFSNQTIVYKGMLKVDQLRGFYPDLSDPLYESNFALVHSRFSTNTFPSWERAQPFRNLCHNGEINTLRGNVNRMHSREDLQFPSRTETGERRSVLTEGGSDSMILDNAIELLVHSGRSLPHAMMMVIPEAWEKDRQMDPARKAFYEYHACLMEPWDGPACLPFSDGRFVGAVLDRNGLRPCRYMLTADGLAVLSSEAGVYDIDESQIIEKGRVSPGRMFLVDLEEQRIISDEELKRSLSESKPYKEWLDHLISLDQLGHADELKTNPEQCRCLRRNFGYSLEDLEHIITPMAEKGKEALGSMGNDTPLAVLSDHCRPLFDYFKQLFAQVTNPPLDAIREDLVTAMVTYVGSDSHLTSDGSHHCRRLRLDRPVISNQDLARIGNLNEGPTRSIIISLLYDGGSGLKGLEGALKSIFKQVDEALFEGISILILSDRGVNNNFQAVPSLLASSAVHHYLIRSGMRASCGIVVESGEPREVHHFCCLIGYGASAVNPYLALDGLRDLDIETPFEKRIGNYLDAANKGITKVMSKMGISTLQSYRGAQIFEAIGLSDELVSRYFTGTTNRLGGIGLATISDEIEMNHEVAYSSISGSSLPVGGIYSWRRSGESHHYTPSVVANLQQASQTGNFETYQAYSKMVNDSSRSAKTLRGLLDFKSTNASIDLDEVEPWTEIVKRFKTGAMSYGSISSEAHRTLAIAMNEIEGKSNTGEGGEEEDRYSRDSSARSRIKQVASGRFGVTISYLASADEIQIKMAQGAKPGEGGHLPGEKVFPWIAKTRNSTPFVGLISPPPHHDIYSIEDLAQLIFDLKSCNPSARISVKLVSEAGVGTIAAGVAKGLADVVLISGYDGGTGASPKTSIMHSGLPWELGLAETNQTLLLNGLRKRIKIECDGQLKTGRDVAIAALLGADEYGFATAPLVSMGCVMMRKCHLNTCPVGIATQDENLRKNFKGKPEHVINFFHFVAEELRRIMAELGFRTLDEMVGRVEMLEQVKDIAHRKAGTLNLSSLLFKAKPSLGVRSFDVDLELDPIAGSKDQLLIEKFGKVESVEIDIGNEDRSLGTGLSAHVESLRSAERLSRKKRETEESRRPSSGQIRLFDNSEFRIFARGSAGQSAAAFLAKGLRLEIEGEANDYLGKGMSGGVVVVKPKRSAAFVAANNTIIGNVAFYGATSGSAFISGRAGERFCVRNSGVKVVVEGIGDHGCEYMTGGRVVILGSTGKNFGAGMSGGYAFVFDKDGSFQSKCNLEMIRLDRSHVFHEELHRFLELHVQETASEKAKEILSDWEISKSHFVRVVPIEYEKALLRKDSEMQVVKSTMRESKKLLGYA